MAVALVSGGCATPGPTATAGPTTISIRTSASAGPNDACMDARGGGTLVEDPVSGLGFADLAGHVVHVFWPYGYAARPDGDRLALVDPSGQIIAHVGDMITTGGGYVGAGPWAVCAGSIQVLATPEP